jgi:hypothetical protein
MSEIDRYTEQKLKGLEQAVIRTLTYCGELCLNVARSTNSYKDQTGNLRSSIGYVVTVDGRIVNQSDFETVKKGGDGSKQGAAFAKQLVRRFPKGICLIVVAGMDYAVHVKNRGYDVLDSSELTADRIVPYMLKQLGFK